MCRKLVCRSVLAGVRTGLILQQYIVDGASSKPQGKHIPTGEDAPPQTAVSSTVVTRHDARRKAPGSTEPKGPTDPPNGHPRARVELHAATGCYLQAHFPGGLAF